MRIKLIVEYDGTVYAGWQRQNNALSVQEVLEDNVFAVTGERVAITGAGRTDSGVHARMQVAHFDTGSRVPPEKFSYALNAGLPPDVRVQWSGAAGDGFHARFGATRKQYRYTINTAPHASAIMGRFEHHIHDALEVRAMRAAARYVTGRQDFSAFMAAGAQVKDTVREVYESEIRQDGARLHYDVAGNGFLYNMVRIIVGTLIEVGYGKIPPAKMEDIIASRDRKTAGPTAPAKGLTLMRVSYD